MYVLHVLAPYQSIFGSPTTSWMQLSQIYYLVLPIKSLFYKWVNRYWEEKQPLSVNYLLTEPFDQIKPAPTQSTPVNLYKNIYKTIMRTLLQINRSPSAQVTSVGQWPLVLRLAIHGYLRAFTSLLAVRLKFFQYGQCNLNIL